MDGQQFWHLSSMPTWIFVFFALSACSGMDTPKLSLNSTVFVAFTGEDLNIFCDLKIPENQIGGGVLTCSDPLNQQIYACKVSESKIQTVPLELKNLTISGEYSCQYNSTRVYLFLRVRSGVTSPQEMWDYTEYTEVGILTVLLLVFSIAGSVCVFRGYGKDCITGCGDSSGDRKERKETEVEENNVDAITAPSSSFYASLKDRPGSIYDELDLSAANTEPDHNTAKPKTTVAQTTQDQGEGIFENVYENF